MKVKQFFQPSTEAELVTALTYMHSPDSYVVAGGTDFLALRHSSSWQAENILSLAKLPFLSRLEQEGEHLSIGAACTHAAISGDHRINQYFPALAKACGDIGSVQIRNRGTIGGNLVNASPAGDTIPCLFLFEAQAELLDAAGQKRMLPVADFLLGPGKTALRDAEILTRLLLPLPAPGWQNSYWKLGTRSKVTISQIVLAAAWKKEAQALSGLRLYIGSISQKPLLIAEAAALLGTDCP